MGDKEVSGGGDNVDDHPSRSKTAISSDWRVLKGDGQGGLAEDRSSSNALAKSPAPEDNSSPVAKKLMDLPNVLYGRKGD